MVHMYSGLLNLNMAPPRTITIEASGGLAVSGVRGPLLFCVICSVLCPLEYSKLFLSLFSLYSLRLTSQRFRVSIWVNSLSALCVHRTPNRTDLVSEAPLLQVFLGLIVIIPGYTSSHCNSRVTFSSHTGESATVTEIRNYQWLQTRCGRERIVVGL